MSDQIVVPVHELFAEQIDDCRTVAPRLAKLGKAGIDEHAERPDGDALVEEVERGGGVKDGDPGACCDHDQRRVGQQRLQRHGARHASQRHLHAHGEQAARFERDHLLPGQIGRVDHCFLRQWMPIRQGDHRCDRLHRHVETGPVDRTVRIPQIGLSGRHGFNHLRGAETGDGHVKIGLVEHELRHETRQDSARQRRHGRDPQ